VLQDQATAIFADPLNPTESRGTLRGRIGNVLRIFVKVDTIVVVLQLLINRHLDFLSDLIRHNWMDQAIKSCQE